MKSNLTINEFLEKLKPLLSTNYDNVEDDPFYIVQKLLYEEFEDDTEYNSDIIAILENYYLNISGKYLPISIKNKWIIEIQKHNIEELYKQLYNYLSSCMTNQEKKEALAYIKNIDIKSMCQSYNDIN